MYIVYEEHIERLEEENEELEQKVLILQKRLKYYQKMVGKNDHQTRVGHNR